MNYSILNILIPMTTRKQIAYVTISNIRNWKPSKISDEHQYRKQFLQTSSGCQSVIEYGTPQQILSCHIERQASLTLQQQTTRLIIFRLFQATTYSFLFAPKQINWGQIPLFPFYQSISTITFWNVRYIYSWNQWYFDVHCTCAGYNVLEILFILIFIKIGTMLCQIIGW